MALATLTTSPLPSSLMMDFPLPPFTARRLLPDERQNGCVDHMASFALDGAHPSLKLQLLPRRNSDSMLIEKSLMRMKQQGEKKKRRTEPPTASVEALAASIMAARTGLLNSPKKSTRLAKLSGNNNTPNKTTVRRTASFGRARLSPVRAAPLRTRSAGSSRGMAF